jgi:formate C-acetyltransferase
MLWNSYFNNRDHLESQYSHPNWIEDSGLSYEVLETGARLLVQQMEGQSKSIIKARIFEYILLNGRIDVDPADWFQDRIQHGRILQELRQKWWRHIDETVMEEMHARERVAWSVGAFFAGADFSHTSPDWNSLLDLGIPGLLERIRDKRNVKLKSEPLCDDEATFYEASEIVYAAVIAYMLRLVKWAKKAAETDEKHRERMLMCAECLENLTVRRPETMYEALQLSLMYYMLQEMEGEPIRSHGGFDRLFCRFFENDIECGCYTLEQEKELIRYFYTKLNANRFSAGRPFYLGGTLSNDKDAVNTLSYIALAIYNELGLPYIKLHIRVHPGISDDFLKKALDCIRNGNNSIVFINDETVVPALIKTGVTQAEAREYVPIGCYEPAVMGKEVPCTFNSFINTAKAVELTLHGGIDPLTGVKFGLPDNLSDYISFDAFYNAVKKQISWMVQSAMNTILKYENYYMEINPSPLFSGTLTDCVNKGRDAYAGGARYNNSSIVFGCLGSAVDSLLSIRKFVFDKQELSLNKLATILRNNWADNELLRMKINCDHDKWGNNRPEADMIARDIMDFASALVANKPNNRGGVFKAGLFTIDHHIYCGSKMGATPDGRKAFDPLSKNLSSVTAMDRRGVTALINSAVKIDFTHFPDGSVLDIMLHPSVTRGNNGITAMLGLVRTYFRKGGFAMQFNIFDVNTLKKAQVSPQKFANLQIRVCGWNAYFINLGETEQNEFIRQAENMVV